MLERAAVCVEPATQLFLLRSFDRPVRTHRVLDPGFWRHATNQLPAAAWWPLYLENVRGASTPGNGRRRTKTVAQPPATPKSHGQHVPKTPFHNRAFSGQAEKGWEHSTRYRTAQPALSRIELEDDVADEQKDDDPGGNGRNVADKRGGDGDKDSNPVRTSRRKHAMEQELTLLLSSTAKPDFPYEQIWNKFLSVEIQARFASRILDVLASSSRPQDLNRAGTAFNLILREDRSKLDYDNAVKVAAKQGRYALANKINEEAISKEMGDDCGPYLLSICINQGLWQNAGKVWTTMMVESQAHDFKSNNAKDTRNWTPIDEMLDLPEMLYVLLQRLRSDNAILASVKQQLLSMSHQLLLRMVASQKIMGKITPEGFVQLVDISHFLEVWTNQHYLGAIRTLFDMAHSRNRPDFAFLIYRNLRFREPTWFVPEWVYGSMVYICMQTSHGVEAYEYILEEMASMHRNADKTIYHQVMTALSRNGDVEGVKSVFERLVNQHGAPSVLKYYTPLLYAYARVGNVDDAKRHFDYIQQRGFMANNYCWNMLLLAHVKSSHPETAFNVFNEMLEKNIKPDAYTFGTVLALCANSGDTGAVHSLIAQAGQHKIPITLAMIDSLVHSYCMNDEPEHAEEIAERALQMRLEGSPTRMWNNIVRHYAFEADAQAVLRVQARMRELNVKPDAMTYAALMSALVIVGKTDNAVRILRSLHLNQLLTITPFHYSIIIHGYEKEKNRDMANVIFHEMVERFPHPTRSSKLAMLRLQGQRDTAVALDKSRVSLRPSSLNLDRTFDYLLESSFQDPHVDAATKHPQPGHAKFTADQAPQSVYFELLLRVLTADGQVDRAEKLLARYEELSSNAPRQEGVTREGLSFYALRMMIASQKGRWVDCDKIWDRAFEHALDVGGSKLRHMKAAGLLREQEKHVHAARHPLQNISKMSTVMPATFTSMIADPVAPPEGQKGHVDGPLPAQRFILSFVLQRYMHALAAQNRVDDIIKNVTKLQEAGFALSGKNWNGYVQHLCQSGDGEKQLLAFETCEKIFQPNYTFWRLQKRGKWVDKSVVVANKRGRLEPVGTMDRRTVEKLRPELAIATYYTTVYLASVLVKFHRLSLEGKNTYMARLEQRAPKSLDYIRRIPYLRDRVQGLLLRGRKLKGDRLERPRIGREANRAGITGSGHLFDQLARADLEQIESNLTSLQTKDRDPSKGEDEACPSVANVLDVDLAQRLHGEADLQPRRTARGVPESSEQFSARTKRGKERAEKTLNSMKQGLEDLRIVNNPILGEPHVDAIKSVTAIIRASNDDQDDRADLVPSEDRAERSAEENKSDVARILSEVLEEQDEASDISDSDELDKTAINRARSRRTTAVGGSSSGYTTSIFRQTIPTRPPSSREARAFTDNKQRRISIVEEKLASRRQIARGGRLRLRELAKARRSAPQDRPDVTFDGRQAEDDVAQQEASARKEFGYQQRVNK